MSVTPPGPRWDNLNVSRLCQIAPEVQNQSWLRTTAYMHLTHQANWTALTIQPVSFPWPWLNCHLDLSLPTAYLFVKVILTGTFQRLHPLFCSVWPLLPLDKWESSVGNGEAGSGWEDEDCPGLSFLPWTLVLFVIRSKMPFEEIFGS